MARPMRTSAEGIALIQSFEGFRPRAARLPGGGWLIGHGHTATARAGLQISERDAALILRHHDLPPIEQQIAEQVLSPLSQNEFDALVSFAFNIGANAFASCDVVAALNAGDRAEAANAMWSWRLASLSGELRVVDALVRRRAAEIALFLKHPDGPAGIPGALVRPLAQKGQDDEETLDGARTLVIGARSIPGGAARSPQNSTQAAARAVSERIARILGEAPPQPPAPPLTAPAAGDGPTPEEITDALKALVGDDPAPPVTPVQRPRSPPEGIERRRSPRPPACTQPPSPAEDPLQSLTIALPPAEGIVVDDLEIAEVDPRDLERAIQENGGFDRAGLRHPGAWIPYALLSGLGMAGLIAGLQRVLHTAQGGLPGGRDAYAGPVLALGGGFLFLMASYYLYRALRRQD